MMPKENKKGRQVGNLGHLTANLLEGFRKQPTLKLQCRGGKLGTKDSASLTRVGQGRVKNPTPASVRQEPDRL